MTQQVVVVELRLVFETDTRFKSKNRSEIVDRVSAALAKVTWIPLSFAFFEGDTGRRLRKTDLVEGSIQMKEVMKVELVEEDVVAR